MRRISDPKKSKGFTLVEMIVVIAITAIIGGMVAVFISSPVQAYIDSVRRAELTDVADTALRRITRDLQSALPNSVRVDASGKYIEFLQMRTGGRYRSVPDGAGAGDPLNFVAADTGFDTLHPLSVLVDDVIVAGDSVVIYNLGIPGADAYSGVNRSTITSTAAGVLANEGHINFGSKLFPLASPGNRFQVITGPVTYGCDLGTGLLTRYSGYAISSTQAAPPTSASTALLAGESAASSPMKVASCQFTYAPNAVAQRNGLVMLQLQLQKSGESVRLFQQAHVSNVP